jgi:two-component system LytT family sensor kinase
LFENILYRRIILTYLTWWGLWIIIQVYILHHVGLSYTLSATDSIINNLLLALVGFAMYNMMRFYRPDKENFFYLRLWIIAITAFCALSVNWLLKQLYPTNKEYAYFLEMALPLRVCYNFLMVSFITLLNWMMYYFKNERAAIKRKTDAENLSREAELTSLRQQLQPHFLFNSLNSISALAGSRPEEARKMIQQLSDFLRGTLKKDDQQMVTLKEELQHLQLYLEIEKVRFGHRLNTVIDCNESTSVLLLPSLLLQPVVENAIKFGLYDTIGEITIHIYSRIDGNDLVITVENPFDPETSKPQQGTGFGLNSVQRRLYLLFSRKDLLSTRADKNKFITTVKIPQHTR